MYDVNIYTNCIETQRDGFDKNPQIPCLDLNEYYIEQTIIYSNCYYSSLNYNKWYFQWFACNLKHVYWKKVNTLKPTLLWLYQPLSEPASFLLATMRIAGTPSHGMCYHKHTLPSILDVLNIYHLSSHTRIAPFRTFGHITLVYYISLKYYTIKYLFKNSAHFRQNSQRWMSHDFTHTSST